jgi:hypothetical protein
LALCIFMMSGSLLIATPVKAAGLSVETAQLMCLPVSLCGLDHFSLENDGRVHYNYQKTPCNASITVLSGMHIDTAAGSFNGLARVTHLCEAWLSGTPSTPHFSDVVGTDLESQAIRALAMRNIARGNGDGTYSPDAHTLRAQMAALIARSNAWDLETHGAPPFSDQGVVDNDLWRNVGTLAFYNVARGYGDGTYNPTGDVLQAQIISFITRGMESLGCWHEVGVDGGQYSAVPASSGHRPDVLTYYFYVGTIDEVDSTFSSWDQPGSRGWFAVVLERALEAGCGS